MGGFGSGRWKNFTKKRTVEECWMLNLAWVPLGDPTTEPPCGVVRAIGIDGGSNPLPVHYTLVEDEGPYLDITYPVRRGAPEDMKERLKLLSTPPNYGGARWYFSCPFTTEEEHCKARVSKLYLPPGERQFGCRKCHDLTYESSQTNHKYDGLYATLAGEREGETFATLKRAYDYQLREERKQRAQGQRGVLEAFEERFKEHL